MGVIPLEGTEAVKKLAITCHVASKYLSVYMVADSGGNQKVGDSVSGLDWIVQGFFGKYQDGRKR
jgi:hypothetical protein